MTEPRIPIEQSEDDDASGEELTEAQQFDEGKADEFRQRRRFRKHLSVVILIALWTAAALIGVIVWHLATPSCWHFLNPAQQNELRSIALTGISSAFATNYLRRYAD